MGGGSVANCMRDDLIITEPAEHIIPESPVGTWRTFGKTVREAIRSEYL